jgi:hypothetical protein
MAMPIMETKILVSGKKSITIQESNAQIKILIDGQEDNLSELVPSPNNEQKKLIAHARKREFYSGFLKSHFENLVILSGAGTSVGWGGKTMKELWDAVKTGLTSAVLSKFCIDVSFDEGKQDLEALLSRAHIAKEFITDRDIDATIKMCEQIIQANCKLSLTEDAPHEAFLNKITDRKLKDPRVKLFTLNYDTLFEQAAIKGNFTFIDGFSFSTPRTMSGRNFDYDLVYRERSRIKEEESFVPKVFHLYKPHGSINWELDETNDIITINELTKRPLMIFPRDSKYENSYDQPFFEMMSRFQQSLRNDNVLLVCVGFSFTDKHLVNAIKEAVRQNPSFRLLIVSRTIRDNGEMRWFVDMAQRQFNVILVAEEFKDFTKNYPYSKIYSEEKDVEE